MPLIELQQRYSRVPAADELLVEQHRTREGMHLCVFPFAGRHVHSGLAALVAWRLAQRTPLSFSMAFNDYGFELLSPTRLRDRRATCSASCSSPANAQSRHHREPQRGRARAAALPRDRARDRARVPGLSRRQPQREAAPGDERAPLRRVRAPRPGQPAARAGEARSARARARALAARSARSADLAGRRIVLVQPQRLTPLALPLIAEQMRNKLSTEQLATRVARMQLAMQNARRSANVRRRESRLPA